MTTLRSFARTTALVLTATLAACSDSTKPLDMNPDQLQAIGETVASEIEGSALQLTAGDAVGGLNGPALAVVQARTTRFAPAARRGTSPTRFGMQAVPIGVGEGCGVASEDPPTDTDEDGVPNNVSVTFALPACHFEDIDGAFDLTGVMRLSDPTPGTAGMAMSLALDNFRIAFSGDFDGSVRRNGSATVAASGAGLSQIQSWQESAEIAGFPGISVDLDWTSTFAPATGSTIVAGEPLPNGTYQPSGSILYREGNREGSFTVTTTQPLQYDAACAAGVLEGTAFYPFSAGQVRVDVANDDAAGYARITYNSCDDVTVQFVAQ